MLHVHDLVDYVSQEAKNAGKYAARYILSSKQEETESAPDETPIRFEAKNGVRYTVPQLLRFSRMEEQLTVRFRVGAVYRDCAIGVYLDGQRISLLKKKKLAPGEMEQIILKRTDLSAYQQEHERLPEHITIQVEAN